ncbi:MAG: PD-(D/E)XK nuclease family transposase [Candidatus Cryptobacteroides sp.]|nr:Rpn family recombination-promoting nuclease/putative transposase [Bacteroidales bacterium]MDY2774063.1 PD-(D/E)XK nuclease family transposase [Candidatus Cryptobacteroides sp.]
MIKKFPPLPPEYSGAARTADNAGNNVNNNATVSGYSTEDLLCLLEDGPDDFGIDFSEDELRYLDSQVYVDLLSDPGFKTVFCSPDNSDLLIALINVMLRNDRHVEKIINIRNEVASPSIDGGRVVMDLTCIDEQGRIFDIEVQKVSNDSLFKRFVNYACKTYELGLRRPTDADSSKSDRRNVLDNIKAMKDEFANEIMQDEFANEIDDSEISVRPLYRPSIYSRLKPVYVIVILKSKPMPEDGVTYGQRLFSHYTLKEYSTNEFAPSTINIIFASLGFFDKKPGECTTDLDRWCYMFKHLGKMKNLPSWVEDKVMARLLSASRVANFNKVQKKLYIKMSMDKEALIDDLNSVWNFGVKKGLKQGRKQGIQQQARNGAKNLILAGVPFETIASCMGLSIDEVKKLAEN